MRNTKSAFTLVELIVVITILAILGTIAFISLQGYSADARNSKRTTDLSNIASSLNIKVTTGMDILAVAANTGSNVTSASIAGGVTLSDSNYKAGTVNYTALDMKQTEFQDPSDDSNYVAGATSLAGGVFQIAATMEGDNGDEAKINGTYNPRTATAISITSASGSTQATLDSTTSIGTFKAGDLVDWDNTTGLEIRKISADWMTITFTAATDDDNTTLELSASETAGLIADQTTATAPVVDGGSTYLPY